MTDFVYLCGMKVLFVGDYSNFHARLATELRRRGHEVTVMSEGSHGMDTPRDIDITRRPGIRGSFAYLYRLFQLMPQMSGYDVVQIINTNFLELKPGRIRYFFRHLKRTNGMVSMALAGTDPVFVGACTRTDTFRYSEHRLGHMRSPYAEKDKYAEYLWMHPRLQAYARYVYDNVDCAVSALYEYDAASRPLLADRLAYIGLPVDVSSFAKYRHADAAAQRPYRILAGVKEELALQKGSLLLLDAARRIEADTPGLCVVDEVRNLPYREYLKKFEAADIVLDQIYSYTPAMAALQAMAAGKIAVSGGEEEYYRFIGENTLRPVVNIDPMHDDIEATLRSLMADPVEMQRRQREGIEFVEKHNRVETVTDRLLAHWQKYLK